MGNLREVTKELDSSPIYKRLLAYGDSSPAARELAVTVEKACGAAFQQAKTVIKYLPNYTLHDATHLFKVLELMGRLIPPDTLASLSPLELALLILSAFWHDIGMAPPEEQVRLWRGEWSGEPGTEEIREREEFLAFCRSVPEYWERFSGRELTGGDPEAAGFLDSMVEAWIRKEHTIRGARMIRNGKFLYGNFDFRDMLARICASHGEDANTLLQGQGLEVARLVGDGEYVNEVFMAVVLRLADLLDFSPERAPEVLLRHLAIRDRTSLLEWAKHRAIGGWDIGPGRIAVDATCEHPAVEQALRRLVKGINRELDACRRVLAEVDAILLGRGLPRRYRLDLPEEVAPVVIRPQTDESGRPIYIYRDIEFRLDQEQIVKLLMGTSLYGEAVVALRELLQNALDACRLARVLHQRWGIPYQPHIWVALTHADRSDILEVWDNGVGMDWSIIENYFARVGRSYYQSAEFRRENIRPSEFNPISRFGIGFLSTFMVAEKVDVDTRRLTGPYQAAEPISLEIPGLWSIFWAKPGRRESPGTTVRLYLKPGHPFVSKEEARREHPLLAEVRRVAAHVEVPIEVYVGGRVTRVVDKGFSCSSKVYELEKLYNCVKVVPLKLNDPGGLRGMVWCILLQENGQFTDIIELDKAGRVIDDEYVEFTLALVAAPNSIEEAADSLGMSDTGTFDLNPGYSTVISSQGRLSVKGIGVPFNLFAEGSFITRRYDLHKRFLSWPIAVEYDIDLSGEWELNLTATRDRVVMDGTWEAFKERFTRLVAGALGARLGAKRAVELARAVSNDWRDPFIVALVEGGKERQERTINPYNRCFVS